MTPEEKARARIDAMLAASGWVVQTKDNVNLAASRGVAICELSFVTGEPDYTLFVDGKAIGTLEAKPAGHSLTGVEEQSAKYATGVPKGLPAWRSPLPFCCESTGDGTRFTSRLDPEPFAESVTGRFHEWLMDKAQAGVTFHPDQMAWLNLIRDHIATAVSMELEDFDYAPFSQQGGLGNAHQLFGADLTGLLEELNTVLTK